jgi:hypothetical protein
MLPEDEVYKYLQQFGLDGLRILTNVFDRIVHEIPDEHIQYKRTVYGGLMERMRGKQPIYKNKDGVIVTPGLAMYDT